MVEPVLDLASATKTDHALVHPRGCIGMIVYEWSRIHMGGSIRAITFARVLARRGWRLEVFTASPPEEWPEAVKEVTVHHIPSRERSYGGGISVDHGRGELGGNPAWLRALSGLKRLLPLERQLAWYPEFWRTVPDLCRAAGVDRVLTIVAPNVMMPLGHRLSGRLKVPHVIDLRDDFADRHAVEPITRSYQRLLNTYGQYYLRRASAVTVVSPVTRNRLHALNIPATVVMNGYVEDHFAGVKWAAPAARPGGPLRVLHLGWLGDFRSIEPLLAAVSGLANSEDVRIDQYGFIDPRQAQLLADAACQTEIHPQVPHSEAIRLMQEADVLLAIPGDRVPAAMTGKLFEYFRSRRPVLLVTGQGAARELGQTAGMRYLCDPGNIAGLQRTIEEMMAAKAAGMLHTESDPAFVRTLDREIGAERMDVVLGEVAA
ncbi:MAG: hypothetical protein ACI9W4_000896 [Rhodothermales bacterium]|jgi:hypothetical protein